MFDVGDKVRVKRIEFLESCNCKRVGIVTQIIKDVDESYNLYMLDISDVRFFDDEIEEYVEKNDNYNLELEKLLEFCNKNNVTVLKFDLNDKYAITEDCEGNLSMFAYDILFGEWVLTNNNKLCII